MAASQLKPQPIGSMSWILEERQQAGQFITQEVEEFTFSARNEIDWLNEHMADIFDREQFDVAEIFKTPGKLRGKTPGTTRKRNPLEIRAPLTDIFAPTPQQSARSPSHTTPLFKHTVQFKVAEDVDDVHQAPQLTSRWSIGAGKENTDSGYHGMTEDEMDLEGPQQKKNHLSPSRQSKPSPQKAPSPVVSRQTNSDETRESEVSFVSAKEALGGNAWMETVDEDGDTTEDDTEVAPMNVESVANTGDAQPYKTQERTSSSFVGSVFASAVSAPSTALQPIENGLLEPMQPEDEDGSSKRVQADDEDVQSSSDGSTPERLLLRKSSLTFASLPAREPLPTKRSMGARASRTSQLDQARVIAGGRNSQLGVYGLGKSLGGAQQKLTTSGDHGFDGADVDEERPPIGREESETTRLHNKTSTQRLHERITMLGQSQAPRPSKSIPTTFTSAAPVYPQLPAAEMDLDQNDELTALRTSNNTKPAEAMGDDDGDWIAPIKPSEPSAGDNTPPQLAEVASKEMVQSVQTEDNIQALHDGKESADSRPGPPARGLLGQPKSTSASVLTSSTKPAPLLETMQKKIISTSHPNMVPLSSVYDSNTPAGSPSTKRHVDGPLSASKAKLYSVLKSAKGIFASSAGVSAQAKLEALSQSPSRLNSKESLVPRDDSLYPNIQKASQNADRAPSILRKADQTDEGRKTRSSTEREQRKQEAEVAEKQRAHDHVKNGKEQQWQEPFTVNSQKNRIESQETDGATDMPPPPPPKNQLPSSQLRKPRDLRRPVKPTRQVSQKTKPAPVSIRVASQRLAHTQPSNTTLSASLHDSLAPPPPPKQNSMAATASASLYNGLPPNGSKPSTAPTAAKPKALEAAAKKKEQDEREAQRKADQKRELERKRAAKQEEERKAEEQRRAAEQERLAEAKKAAQKQAAEQRRLDLARKAEQQRSQAAAAKLKQTNDFSNALQQERQQATHSRADLGGSRPPSRMNMLQDVSRPVPQPPINPAKPPKRAFQADSEDQVGPRPTIQRGAPSYQQNDAKRRKTDEEDGEEPEIRLSKAPPIRLSHIRKDIASKFQHGYMAAPAPGNAASSMLKTVITTQHSISQLKAAHPNDMAKFSSAKIPFAEVNNPPQNTVQKTPAASASQQQPVAKSSPSYPHGDSISLPEIATDSEDEDEDTDFRAPSWAASPALRELLSQQQLVDPQSVFGPIAPLQMEEMFKGNPDRLRRFRQRTSSAIWDRGDRVTEEERRRDMEARERLEREGGWRFVPGGS